MTIEKLQEELEQLENKKEGINRLIISKQNRIRAEQEKEQSPAEKWAQKVFNDLKTSGGHAAIHVKLIAMQAHEAGQKHGAEVERGKYGPLMEIAKFIADFPQMFLSGLSSETWKKVCKALKNLEENEPADEGGLPEKPSWITAQPNQELTFSINGKLVKIKIPDGGESIEIDTELGIQISRKTENKS